MQAPAQWRGSEAGDEPAAAGLGLMRTSSSVSSRRRRTVSSTNQGYAVSSSHQRRHQPTGSSLVLRPRGWPCRNDHRGGDQRRHAFSRPDGTLSGVDDSEARPLSRRRRLPLGSPARTLRLTGDRSGGGGIHVPPACCARAAAKQQAAPKLFGVSEAGSPNTDARSRAADMSSALIGALATPVGDIFLLGTRRYVRPDTPPWLHLE